MTPRPDTQPSRAARPESGAFRMSAGGIAFAGLAVVVAGMLVGWSTGLGGLSERVATNKGAGDAALKRLDDHEGRLRSLETTQAKTEEDLKATTEALRAQAAALQQMDSKLDAALSRHR